MKAVADLDAPARAAAEELKAAVEAIHKAGLVTIVRRMRTDDAARALLFEMVDDPIVHLLLALHGIVRPDPVTMANRVLVEVRPQLQSYGGDVSPTLISVDALFIGPDPEAEGWVKAAPVGDIEVGAISSLNLTAASGKRADVIVVNVEQRLTAYVNESAHEGLPLVNALLDLGNGTLTCPWHRFCYDASSGECLSAPGAQLESPRGVYIDDDHVVADSGNSRVLILRRA